MKPIWLDNLNMDEFPSLNDNINTEVLVIGGGIAGILCAYQLTSKGIDTILVEQNRIGMGIIKGSTATISAQQDVLYQDLIKSIGQDNAKLFLEANLLAIDQYRNLADRIDFDFKEVGCIAYSQTDLNKIVQEYEALESLAYKPIYHDSVELNVNIKGSLEYPKQAICNPLKLIKELSREITIYENTKIVDLGSKYAVTENDKKIVAKYFIIATHYPLLDKRGFYFAKMHQIKSEVVAIKNEKELSYFYVDIDEGGLYTRDYQGYHLYGGNDCKVGELKKNKEAFVQEIQNSTSKEVSYSWSNQDLVTLDGMPYIGKHSIWHKNIFVATGFNAYGLTGGMLSSLVLTDLIMGVSSPYAELFSPQRKYKVKNFILQMGTSIGSLLRFGGKRCTHLGCKLKYNKDTKAYECVCHGSRFAADGTTLNDPARKDLKTKD